MNAQRVVTLLQPTRHVSVAEVDDEATVAEMDDDEATAFTLFFEGPADVVLPGERGGEASECEGGREGDDGTTLLRGGFLGGKGWEGVEVGEKERFLYFLRLGLKICQIRRERGMFAL